MNADRQKVIDRIQKLLALANSTNEHEARAAAEKANELLVRYNLDVQSVRAATGDMGSLDDDYEARVVFDKNLRTPQQKFIFPLIGHYFFVRIVHHRPHKGANVSFTFVGEKANVAVAAFVHDFLLAKFPELWRAYQKTTGAPLTARQSYWTGLQLGLAAQFKGKRDAVQTETGLVVVADPNLERYMAHLYGKTNTLNMGKKSINDADAVRAGRDDGAKLKINRPLGESANAGAPRLALGGRK